MGMSQQDSSKGRVGITKCGRSCCPLLMKALLRLSFSFTISAKKSQILSQREQNEGKALAPPRAVPPKREYLDGGCRKGGLGGRAAGVAQAHTFFMKEKSQRLTSLSLTGDICLIAGLSPPNIGSRSRRGFLNKKLPLYIITCFN